MRYAYPAHIHWEEDTYLVTFPDVPEASAQGDTLDEAAREAEDALIAGLLCYIQAEEVLPAPSTPEPDQRLIPLPLLVAAKLALYDAMQEQGITRVELARRLDVTESIARRLLDLDHASKIERVQDALTAVGYRAIVDIDMVENAA